MISPSMYLAKHGIERDADVAEYSTPGLVKKCCACSNGAEWDTGIQIHAKLLLARGDGNRGGSADVEDSLIIRHRLFKKQPT